MQTAAVTQYFKISRRRLKSLQLLDCVTLRNSFRGRRAVRARQEHPSFFCDPDWPNQQINRSLEKRRMVSLDPVAEKEKHPSAQKKSRSPGPFHEQEKGHPRKYHRDANTMQEFVPAGFVLVIVLRHVVRQARHKRTSCQPFLGGHRFGGCTATVGNQTLSLNGRIG